MFSSRVFIFKFFGLGLIFSTVTSSITDVPVLIWGGDSSTKSISKPFNLFDKTSQKDFKDIVTKKVGDSQLPVIVFYKESFCREDVTLHDNDQWKQLKKFGSLQYIPEVDRPFMIIETLPFYNQSSDEDLNSVSNGQLVINRANDLDFVFETFKMLKESSPYLLGILTGKTCTLSRPDRIKRAAATAEPLAQNDTDPIFVQSERVLFYLEKPPALQMKGSEFISVGQPKEVKDEGQGTIDSPIVLKMDFDVVGNDTSSYKASLAFEIIPKTSGYYTLHRVNVTRDSKEFSLFTKTDLTWPQNFSYHCGQVVQFSKSKSNETEEIKLNLYNIQVQLFARKFSDTYDCVGFTSISIWSGIFVTAILGLIMIWGLIMMMDIRTMDRFDDPKGKTITISSQD
ncbi:V-type proton ATPase subunit S1 [Microplitis demolitor]|uniref:V-type proton ATPase subunit S1 n=1 Tax=Microplitis demolitor TaxID=69319 RepID=UPI0004400412|nr:V-type proton ATPase subunit S1 [Microplitis demolitor]